MNRRLIIIVALVGLLVLMSVITVFLSRPSENPSTGGSGKLEEGYLVLRGYQTPTNDDSKIPLRTFLTAYQQTNIRSFLEAALFKIKPMEQYTGEVIPGSVNVNYSTSDIQFEVQIEEPNQKFNITYNSLTDDIRVTDEDGKSVDPSST